MAEVDPDDLAKAIQGDYEALARLLKEVAPRVRAVIAQGIKPRHRSKFDEEDVMQVTYLEVYQGVRAFKPNRPESFEAWVRQIAIHNLMDAEKAIDARPPEISQATTDDERTTTFLDRVGIKTTSPLTKAGTEEIRRLIRQKIDLLPEDYGNVVRLYDLEGLGAAETAKRMKRSEGAIYMLRARALDWLRVTLPGQSKLFSKGA